MQLKLSAHGVLRTAILGISTLLTLASPAMGEQSFSFKLVQLQLPGPQQTLRIQQGERLLLNWQSDQEVTLHLHGYDQILKLKPGQPSTMQLLADRSGRFALSTHLEPVAGASPVRSSAKHGHGKRPLLYLEVLPR